MQIGGRPAGGPGVAGLTPYVATTGSAEIRTSAGPLRHSVSAGQWWTLVVDDGRLHPIADPAPPPATRASLVLYNLCKGEAALFTEDGSLELISGLAQGEVGQRLVNAQMVRLAVHRGAERLPLPEELLLRRGAVYSVVAQEDPTGRCRVSWQENQTRGQ